MKAGERVVPGRFRPKLRFDHDRFQAAFAQGGEVPALDRRLLRSAPRPHHWRATGPIAHVVVGDRESDIYALFREQAEHRGEAALLVRANAARQRQVQADCPVLGDTRLRAVEAHLDFVEPVVRDRPVVIDSQGGKRTRQKRVARTEVRIAKVKLLPPEEHQGTGPLPVWLVRVLEPGQEALEWLLVSSEGGATAEWAERIVGWYEKRWGIEEYFRQLKTGTRIEDRRLRKVDALVKCLAFDTITAWQVFSLARYARDAPETPTEDLLAGDHHRGLLGSSISRNLSKSQSSVVHPLRSPGAPRG